MKLGLFMEYYIRIYFWKINFENMKQNLVTDSFYDLVNNPKQFFERRILKSSKKIILFFSWTRLQKTKLI